MTTNKFELKYLKFTSNNSMMNNISPKNKLGLLYLIFGN